MTIFQWEYFYNFCNSFKNKVTEWNNQAKSLIVVQNKAKDFFNNVDYELQTPIVYNTALDEITQNDEIKLIVIGDNPGKDEQLAKNQKYLVGQAGKLGNSFFKNHEELGINFRKNVIILNKTPIHSAKTNHLKKFASFGGKEIEDLIKETQIWMAQETAKLHQNLLKVSENKDFPQLWLVGYSELKEKGISVMAVCPFWTKTAFFDRAVTTKEPVVKKYIAMYDPKDIVKRAYGDIKKGKDVSKYG